MLKILNIYESMNIKFVYNNIRIRRSSTSTNFNMKYLKENYLICLFIFSLLLSSCNSEDSVTTNESVEKETKSIEHTKSIDTVVETEDIKTDNDEIKYAIYTDYKSKISIMYPENWQELTRENYVELRGPVGDVIFEVLYENFHELDQFANQYFSESNYQEESRRTIQDPSGYMSIGSLRDGAKHARVIVGNEKAGLILLEATTGPEDNFEKHLKHFQIIIDSLNLKNTSLFDGSNDPNKKDSESILTKTIPENSDTTIYTDPKTGLSFNYPSNWNKVQHKHDTELRGPMGDLMIATTDIPIRELESFIQDFFTEPDEYKEESRDPLNELSGYISIGNLRDESQQARVIIGNEQTGIIIFEATSGPEGDFEAHLKQLQNILNSVILPEVDSDEYQSQKQEYSPTPITNYGPSAIEIVNISEFSTDLMKEWASYSEAKMANRRADILMVLWPVGEFIKEGGFSHPFATMKVVITPDEIDYLMNEIETWLSDQSCIVDDPVRYYEEIEMYRDWLSRGADASTQITICPASRLILMGLPPDMRDTNNPTYPINLQDFFIHELYHGLQQDLMDESCRQLEESLGREETNTPWLVEGGADYFAKHVVAELTGAFDPINRILRNAVNASREEGTNIYQGGIDKTGAAAMQILVELEKLDPEKILDGSLFHNCAREFEYTNDKPYVLQAKNSWYMIEETNGNQFVFSEEALNQ